MICIKKGPGEVTTLTELGRSDPLPIPSLLLLFLVKPSPLLPGDVIFEWRPNMTLFSTE